MASRAGGRKRRFPLHPARASGRANPGGQLGLRKRAASRALGGLGEVIILAPVAEAPPPSLLPGRRRTRGWPLAASAPSTFAGRGRQLFGSQPGSENRGKGSPARDGRQASWQGKVTSSPSLSARDENRATLPPGCSRSLGGDVGRRCPRPAGHLPPAPR